MFGGFIENNLDPCSSLWKLGLWMGRGKVMKFVKYFYDYCWNVDVQNSLNI